MAIEELLHRFGCKIEARELELHQRLEEAQTGNADFAKEIHELRQYVISILARGIFCPK